MNPVNNFFFHNNYYNIKEDYLSKYDRDTKMKKGWKRLHEMIYFYFLWFPIMFITFDIEYNGITCR